MRGMVLGVVLLVVVGLGLAAYGLGILPPDPPPQEVERVSPAAAASAEMKLAQLDDEGEVRITPEELTSLFRFRPEIWSVGILHEPVVSLAGDTVQLTGRVATSDLPPDPVFEPILPLLPDTAQVEIRGRIEPLDSARTILRIVGIDVARMPIPDRYYGPVVDRFGETTEDPLPAGSVPLPLPPGIRSVRVEGGDLVLSR